MVVVAGEGAAFRWAACAPPDFLQGKTGVMPAGFRRAWAGVFLDAGWALPECAWAGWACGATRGAAVCTQARYASPYFENEDGNTRQAVSAVESQRGMAPLTFISMMQAPGSSRGFSRGAADCPGPLPVVAMLVYALLELAAKPVSSQGSSCTPAPPRASSPLF